MSSTILLLLTVLNLTLNGHAVSLKGASVAPDGMALEVSPRALQAEGVYPRGIWLWNTDALLKDSSRQDREIAELQKLGVTDVYVLLSGPKYVQLESEIRAFNAKLYKAGMKPWGLDGERGFFSDFSACNPPTACQGPSALYASADAMIAFNSRVSDNEKFIGFHTDIEPNDGQGEAYPTTFHNEFPSSLLSKTGGGVWQETQALDREMLMQNWIEIHDELKRKTTEAKVRLGAAIPSWADDFQHEEILTTYNGKRQSVMKHLMNFIDDYVIMSYNTNTTVAIERVLGELAYADSLPESIRPKVHAAVDVFSGGGPGATYADTPGKNSSRIVLADMETIENAIKSFPSYAGMSFHEWNAWFKIAGNDKGSSGDGSTETEGNGGNGGGNGGTSDALSLRSKAQQILVAEAIICLIQLLAG